MSDLSWYDRLTNPLSQALAPDPGSTYGAVLPIAQDQSGAIRYALPSLERNVLQGLIAAPKDLMSLFAGPHDALAGTLTPEESEAAQRGIGWLAGGDVAAMGERALSPSGPALSIPAFHGTPHTFEPVEGNPFGKFNDEAVGSGEGAQAYGWGHYFAENPEVAGTYKTAGAAPGSDGNLYQVKLHPDEDQLLDLDKPLSQQSPYVTQKLRQIPEEWQERLSELADRYGNNSPLESPEAYSGKELIKMLEHHVVSDSPEDVSTMLTNTGIFGNKFLDQNSRKAGEGTKNFVIFDPHDIQITHRNGVPVDPVDYDPFAESP